MIVTSQCTELLGVGFVKYTTKRNGYVLDRRKLNPREINTRTRKSQCHDDLGVCWGRSWLVWRGRTMQTVITVKRPRWEYGCGGHSWRNEVAWNRDGGEELNEHGFVGKQRDPYWRG
jgi:hypothetical protein